MRIVAIECMGCKSILWLLVLCSGAVALQTPCAAEPGVRSPVALAYREQSGELFVANRDSGTVSIIDTHERRISDEWAIGGRLSDMLLVDDYLVLLDTQQHQLVTVDLRSRNQLVVKRTDVAHYPQRIVMDEDRKRFCVTSLWSRRVSVFSTPQSTQSPIQLYSIDLALEPLEMALTPGGKFLIVAGAFDAALAVVDLSTGEEVATKQLPGHNIGGLAISQDHAQLLITQQEINPLAHSTRDDIHWGNLIANQLVRYPLSRVVAPDEMRAADRTVTQLGGPNAGAGDPGQVGVHGNSVFMLLSGVNELARFGSDRTLQRTVVGRRPIAFHVSPSAVYVANMFSDSVSVVDPATHEEVDRISLGKRKKQLVDEGELAFFDARLSHDGWMSCHSCHTMGHTNSQLVDNLSDGAFGDAKRVLSLHNVALTSPWAWTGDVQSLEQQVVNSIEKTMRGKRPSRQQVQALSEFVTSIKMPSVPAAHDEAEIRQISRGESLFKSLNCNKCHTPPLYTSDGVFDVGLSDGQGNSSFNPPSLLGVRTGRSFFHDGRSASARDVFAVHRHQLSGELSDADLDALVAYLRSLGQS